MLYSQSPPLTAEETLFGGHARDPDVRSDQHTGRRRVKPSVDSLMRRSHKRPRAAAILPPNQDRLLPQEFGSTVGGGTNVIFAKPTADGRRNIVRRA